MDNDWRQGIALLLANTRIGFLSSQGERSPETSMCPYATYHGDIVLHLSALAKHSKNIQNNTNVGFMICTPENPKNSPLSLARLSLTGTIKAVPPKEHAHYQKAYISNIPDAGALFSFPDFTLYHLEVHNIQWIGGFGKARKIPLETWKSLC